MTVTTLVEANTAQAAPPTKLTSSHTSQLVPQDPVPSLIAVPGHSGSHALQDLCHEDDEVPDEEKVIGSITASFGRKYNIIETGPPNSSKHSIRSIKQHKHQSDTELKEKPAQNEKVTYILGVANYVPPNFRGHMLDLLDPEKWCRPAPLTRVKIGTSNGRFLWVDRDAVRRHWPGGDHEAPMEEDLKVGDHVFLKKGQIVLRSDLAIAKKAVAAEANFRLWQTGKRPAATVCSVSPEDAVAGELITMRTREDAHEQGDGCSPTRFISSGVTRGSRNSLCSKDSRASFDASKQQMARLFLAELDDKVTQGRVAILTKSTGGVKVKWNKSFKSTAGRANFKRETIRTKDVDVQYAYHASIDLAEKILDDETRLLNTVAHEFCHLATYMVSGVTKNPHGKEFKSWAAMCSRAFPDRGIHVTTKHSYEIDFKYAWECVFCHHEYKRHSRCIDPARSRCGKCKNELRQTRPVTGEVK
jgi:predicted SprT family Zn-dependent metalloprotease